MKTKYTFWELLSNYSVEIPKIQRDYAHGRKDSTIVKIVDKFLDDIKKSIKNNEELNLDFVYGKVEDNVLIPLDGQQRLTTLFLIHWYIALKENKLTDEIKSVLSKFTYETRISSADFCKNLITENIDYNSINEKISYTITDSKWYFLSWELDPTVSAMLNMLDTIHNKFKDIEEPIFEKLEKEINVTFQFLPLEKFKLADELYIKMNARGKPLTEFENFKANFSQYLKSIEQKSKLDNEWLDVFWNFEKKENSEIITENVDERFFNFFKNINLNFYTELKPINREILDNYNLFDTYKEVFQNEIYVHQITKILDGLTEYVDDENILKNFLSSSLNYWQRLHFYSLGLFFINYGKVTNENKSTLIRWLRTTKNLINNTRIEGAKEFENGIHSINELSKNIADIYPFISYTSDNIKYFAKIQREEESLKAKLILEDENWGNLFVKIEQHPYFDGQIGFILEYSQKENSSYNKELFDDYSKKLISLFSNDFGENHSFLFQRALLTKGDYLPQVGNGENYTFCLFETALRTKLDNWRKVFNDEDGTLLLKEMLDDLDNDDILNSLKNIVNSHIVNDWRKIIIEQPDIISYCQYRQIRYYSEDKIYVLSKVQMNGKHKEIFSLDLFNRKFDQKEFLPFTNKNWYWESTSFEEPCIVLSGFKYNANRLAIMVTYANNGMFSIKFIDWNNADITDSIDEILIELNLKGNNILPEADIENKISEVCKKLKSLEQEKLTITY